MKTSTRPYRMTARAEATARTAERILDATVALFWESPTDRIVLDEVARRSGVSVQTVIRRFGGKDGLLAAATEREATRVREQRDRAPVGETSAAIEVLLDHYEELGDRVLRMLAEEQRHPAIRAVTDEGRSLHRDWCSRVFAPALARRSGAGRVRLLAQLVTLCDVHTWKLLRHDGGLSRQQTHTALLELLTPLVEEPR